jgi:hypothetical protein
MPRAGAHLVVLLALVMLNGMEVTVDGTAVPDGLHEWAPSFADVGFSAAER